MCWVALDRAIALAGKLGADDHVGAWQQPRTKFTRPWSEGLEREGRRVHAVLRLRRSGCVQPHDADRRLSSRRRSPDPRHHRRHETPHRRTGPRLPVRHPRWFDGLEGEEGTFLLCTFWLAQALALAGRPDEARPVFERAACSERRRTALRGGRAGTGDPSATSPRHSATSDSSTPPGRSPRPSAGRLQLQPADSTVLTARVIQAACNLQAPPRVFAGRAVGGMRRLRRRFRRCCLQS